MHIFLDVERVQINRKLKKQMLRISNKNIKRFLGYRESRTKKGKKRKNDKNNNN